MSSFKRMSSLKSKKDKSIVSTSRKIPTLSSRRASADLMKEGVHNIISLSEGGEMDANIECIAADFTQISKGEIKTVITPLTVRLKKEEEITGLSIGTLESITGAIQKIGLMGDAKPFVRFDRIQIMYCPLFHNNGKDKSKMTIELIDESRSGENERISGVEIPGGVMSLSELSMNFKVKREDMKYIRLRFKAEGIDVDKRSYASMMIAFFVQHDQDPCTYKRKDPMSLILDDMEVPKDIGGKTVFTQLGASVQKRIKMNRAKFNEERRSEERRIERIKRNMAIDDGEDDGEEEDDKEEENSSGEWEELSTVSQSHQSTSGLSIIGPRTASRAANMILDTGAPDHYIYSPHVIPNVDMHNVIGFEKISYKVESNFEMIIGGKVVVLSSVFLVKDNIGRNVISFDRLKEDDLVDRLTITGDSGYLYKESKLVWELEVVENGQLCFLDLGSRK
nr:TPA_asm: movement protein [Primula ophiovirus]